MSTKRQIYKAIICISKKVCLTVVTLFILGTINGQITVEQQLKMLKMDFSELSTKYTDSLISTPSSLILTQKYFINDTIEDPIKIYEVTTIYFEDKVIMVTGPNGAFLFQIKKKFVEENKDGLIEHYYCSKGNNLFLIFVAKSGIYIRNDNSYYSTFFSLEDF